MTEASFQAGRKLMQTANWMRGEITRAKGEVAKWTKIEASYKERLKEGPAEGAKKQLDKALAKLDEVRKRFADLKFPDENISNSELKHECKRCGAKVGKFDKYCDACQERRQELYDRIRNQ